MWNFVCTKNLATYFETNSVHDTFTTNALSMYIVTFTLISILVTDYIQKRRGQALLFSFEYNLSPNLISK